MPAVSQAILSTAVLNPVTRQEQLHAGGLLGYSGMNITRCFAAGSVNAHHNSSAGYGVYAGGLAGYRAGGTISYSAALGAKVIATGGSTASAANRVYGSSTTQSNNYAINSMLTG